MKKGGEISFSGDPLGGTPKGRKRHGMEQPAGSSQQAAATTTATTAAAVPDLSQQPAASQQGAAADECVQNFTAWHDEFSKTYKEGSRGNYIDVLSQVVALTSRQVAAMEITITPRLLGTYIRQGTFTTIFAPSNTGKSIFCYELAYRLAEGKSMFDGVPDFSNESGRALRVAYYDSETSRSSAKARCTRRESDNLFFFTDTKRPLEEALARACLFTVFLRADVLIIDNRTTFCSDSQDTKSNVFMNDYLNAFSMRFGITVLVVAHTPKKGNDLTQPITLETLAGGHEIGDSSGNVIALKKCADGSGVYIKQLKSRDDEIIQGVHTFHIESGEGGGVNLIYDEYTTEKDCNFLNKKDIKQLKEDKIINLYLQQRKAGEISSKKDFWNKNTEFCRENQTLTYETLKRRLKEV